MMSGLLMPFGALPPLAGLAIVSLAAAIGVLLAVRATSNQARLAGVRRSLRACVYELRLYRDDLPTVGRIAMEGVRLNFTALRLALVPALWLIVPFVLLASQLQAMYGYTGLDVGQPAIVKVRLKDSPTSPAERPRLLISPAGLRVETPAVWIPSDREIAWRVVADRTGDFEMRIEYRDEVAIKRVTVSSAAVPRSPETALPAASAISAVAVTYPPASVPVFGQRTHWSVPFFGMSCLFTFALRRRFGVTL